MRRFALAVVLLSSCAPARTPGPRPSEGAVLTPLAPGFAPFSSLEDVARRRRLPLIPFRDLDRDFPAILSRLREIRPPFLQVFVRPEDLDVNLQLALFELSCRVDADPFPDFTWGYLLSCNDGFPERQIPFHSIAEAPLLLLRDGDPGGPLPPIPRGAAVFSGASYAGAASTAYKPNGEVLARRPIPPHRSFPQAVLKAGAACLLAPLHLGDPDLADFEWREAAATGAPLGEILKRTYDLAVLRSGYGSPAVGRFVDGRTAPTGHDDPAFTAITRVLYGDPRTRPHGPRLPRTASLVPDPPEDSRDDQGRPVRRLIWRRMPPDAAPDPADLADPFTKRMTMIWLRAPCPPGTQKAWAEIRECRLGNRPSSAFIETQALEQGSDGAVLHLLVRGDALEGKGLLIDLSIRLR